MEPLRFPQNKRTARSKVFSLIKERSFFRGKVTLASGRESTYYFDMKPSMFDPVGAEILSELILEKLEGFKIDYIGGLEMGAIPLIAAVNAVSSIKGTPVPGFFVRKEVKDHGTKRLVEGIARGASLDGKRVAILDDVTTTGSSAMAAVRAAQESGAKVALVISVVDREEGAAELYKTAGIPFLALFTASEFLAD